MNVRTLSILLAALVIAGLMFRTRPHRATSHRQAEAGDNSGSNSTRPAALPRRPAPPLRAAPDETIPENPTHTNLLARLLKGEAPPQLSLEQVQGYLRDNHRNVESLLGAFHATQDKSLLAEAKEKFPNDPRVDFAAATQSGDSPEEHRQWLEAFKKSAPDNAMADYLSASAYFKSGQADQALQDIQAAANKPIGDFHLDFLQNTQEAYLAAGYSEAEAKTIASIDLLLPEMGAYKSVGAGLVDLAKSYQQTGDTASAQASLQLAMDLGQRVNDPGALSIIQTLVGMSIERMVLNTMDPNAVYGSGNQTVQSQLDAIQQQREYMKSLTQQWDTFMSQMSDQDIVNFWDRHWHFGELAADQWAVTRYIGPQ